MKPYYIVHDDRALIGRYTRLADAQRCRDYWRDPAVVVTREDQITDQHLLALLAHWQQIDKRGQSKLIK